MQDAGMQDAGLCVVRRFERPVRRRDVAAMWRAVGFDCEIFADPPGRTWENLCHALDERVTVLEGRLCIETEAGLSLIEAGDEAFIPRGLRHTLRNVSAGTTRWLYGYERQGKTAVAASGKASGPGRAAASR